MFPKKLKLKRDTFIASHRIVTKKEFIHLLIKNGVKLEEAEYKANVVLKMGASMLINGEMICVKE